MWLLREESQGSVLCQAKTPSSYIIHTTERLGHTLTLPGTITDTLTRAEHPMRRVRVPQHYMQVILNRTLILSLTI